ncbi:adenylate kinase [Candidatus Clavichlamydia salmonicola]|uniref:adenylate kinase n=1 Tax=Candidatus Clavichlamydia salmonicola TaxID=469812 RepID=UPI001891DEAB|nr:adenylate kinase [Candidatus Clavichlamydia salmonicola]MBF5051285.1 adenylate kinase [Candidatus Clavichlamydia salmonicola]
MLLKKILILMGPPGSGKGTQAALIADHYGLPHISIGALLRKEIGQGSKIGLEAAALANKGELVSDQLICNLLIQRLSQHDCDKGFILDGFPRNLAQAVFWVNLINQWKVIHKVINLDVSDSVLVLRIMTRLVCEKCEATFSQLSVNNEIEYCPKCSGKLIARIDDNEETVLTRLRVYHEHTEPLLNFFSKRNELKEIASESSIAEVFEVICILLDKEFENSAKII